MPRQLVVSIHDVTPAHEPRLRRIFDLLAGWGVERVSVLVVPNFHREWDLREHPLFTDWLHVLEGQGHEIVLHGLEHADVEPGKGSPYQRLVRSTYSQEGEFYTLNYESAADRIRRGLELFAEIGFNPVGFTAPAWMQNSEVLRALRDAGLCYATALGSYIDLRRGTSRRAPVLCYSPRKRRTAMASALYCSVLSPLLENTDLVRVAIHPGDVTHPLIVHSLTSVLKRQVSTRQQRAYRDLLEDQV